MRKYYSGENACCDIIIQEKIHIAILLLWRLYILRYYYYETITIAILLLLRKSLMRYYSYCRFAIAIHNCIIEEIISSRKVLNSEKKNIKKIACLMYIWLKSHVSHNRHQASK